MMMIFPKFRSQLFISSLYFFQSVFLDLSPRQILRFQIDNIFPVARIWVQRIFFILENTWCVFFQIVIFNSIDFDVFSPYTIHFTLFSQNVFLGWAVLFVVRFFELLHPLSFCFHDRSFQIVWLFLLFAHWKESFLCWVENYLAK